MGIIKLLYKQLKLLIMKKLSFIALLLIACFSAKLYASETNAIHGEIISYEATDVLGTITINVKCYVKRQFRFISNPVIKLPSRWNYQMVADKTGQSFNKGDSTIISFNITYNTAILPFFPQTIKFTQNVEVENNVNNIQKISAEGKVYFTPYNTVEVWSNADFYNIPRMWLDKASNIDTTRISISKSSISVSNLTEVDTIQYEWQEDWTYKRVEGLAYFIPMKAMHPDSIEWYALNVGDGTDSTTHSTYKGRVRGRLYTYIQNDIGQWKKIYLGGIRVKLLEEDLAWNEVFAEGYTDNNGYFDLSYSKWQTFEGGQIELILQFKSKTKDISDYKIKCKQNNFWENIYEQKIDLGSYSKSYKDIQLGDVKRNHDAFRVVHWARNAMRYFRSSYSSFMGKLEIKIFRPKSYFIGDGVLGVSMPLEDPSIHLEDIDGDHENTVYHEFGHYIMWELQNRNWIAMWCETGDCSHTWGSENTSRLAWCEGWADAMQMILDAYWRNEDGEYGFNKGGGTWPLFERRINFGNNINTGLWAEYYIACAIYDLWDGHDKGLSGNIPGSSPSIHAYNDINNWNTEDNIELSFSQIIQPILNHSGATGKIKHIGEYYEYLLDEVVGVSNCALRSKISRCFAENRVLYDVNRYNNHFGNACLSSDDIYEIFTDDIDGELGFLTHTYTDNYKINLFGHARNIYKNIYFYSYTKRYITDDLWLGDNAPFPTTVYFNINPSLVYGGFPYYEINASSGTMFTCGGADIEVNNGTLTLGGTSTSANLEINSLSLLQIGINGNLVINSNSNIIIKSGGSLYIQNGANVTVEGDAKIIVEPNGYICIEEGANISDLSKIELQQGYNVGINPVLNILHDNCYTIECGTLVYYTHPDKTIVDINDTWNNENFKFRKNLVIQSGTELTINNSYLEFEEKAKIIVEPGAKLVLNNTQITSLSVCDKFWQGIEVWGTSSKSQLPYGNEYQGIVEIENGSVIENVYFTAIKAGKTADNTHDYTGGIIRANNAIFRNNKNGIWIGFYHNFIPNTDKPKINISYITNCTFETTEDYIDITNPPWDFIVLSDVDGIRINGNTFKNTNPDFSVYYRGNGIISYDASYTAKPSCSSLMFPCWAEFVTPPVQ